MLLVHAAAGGTAPRRAPVLLLGLAVLAVLLWRTTWVAAFTGVAVLGCGLALRALLRDERFTSFGLASFVLVALATTLVSDAVHREYFRNRQARVLETATSVLAPGDDMRQFILDDVLKEVRDEPGIAERLGHSRSGERAALAFEIWAQSMLSRLGTSCEVRVYDALGQPASEFFVDIPAGPEDPPRDHDDHGTAHSRAGHRDDDGGIGSGTGAFPHRRRGAVRRGSRRRVPRDGLHRAAFGTFQPGAGRQPAHASSRIAAESARGRGRPAGRRVGTAAARLAGGRLRQRIVHPVSRSRPGAAPRAGWDLAAAALGERRLPGDRRGGGPAAVAGGIPAHHAPRPAPRVGAGGFVQLRADASRAPRGAAARTADAPRGALAAAPGAEAARVPAEAHDGVPGRSAPAERRLVHRHSRHHARSQHQPEPRRGPRQGARRGGRARRPGAARSGSGARERVSVRHHHRRRGAAGARHRPPRVQPVDGVPGRRPHRPGRDAEQLVGRPGARLRAAPCAASVRVARRHELVSGDARSGVVLAVGEAVLEHVGRRRRGHHVGRRALLHLLPPPPHRQAVAQPGAHSQHRHRRLPGSAAGGVEPEEPGHRRVAAVARAAAGLRPRAAAPQSRRRHPGERRTPALLRRLPAARGSRRTAHRGSRRVAALAAGRVHGRSRAHPAARAGTVHAHVRADAVSRGVLRRAHLRTRARSHRGDAAGGRR